MSENPTNLQCSLVWLSRIVAAAFDAHFGNAPVPSIDPLSYRDDSSWLARFVEMHCTDTWKLAVLMMALAPHLAPAFFDKLVSAHLPEGGDFPEFGGVKGSNHRGILPTGETAQFILAGDDLEKRLAVQRLFSSEHWFAQKHILWLESVREGEPAMSGRLILDPEIVEEITTGKVSRPRVQRRISRRIYRDGDGLGRPRAASRDLEPDPRDRELDQVTTTRCSTTGA